MTKSYDSGQWPSNRGQQAAKAYSEDISEDYRRRVCKDSHLSSSSDSLCYLKF